MGSAVPDRETNDFLLRDVTKPLERGDEGDAQHKASPPFPSSTPAPTGN